MKEVRLHTPERGNFNTGYVEYESVVRAFAWYMVSSKCSLLPTDSWRHTCRRVHHMLCPFSKAL